LISGDDDDDKNDHCDDFRDDIVDFRDAKTTKN